MDPTCTCRKRIRCLNWNWHVTGMCTAKYHFCRHVPFNKKKKNYYSVHVRIERLKNDSNYLYSIIHNEMFHLIRHGFYDVKIVHFPSILSWPMLSAPGLPLYFARMTCKTLSEKRAFIFDFMTGGDCWNAHRADVAGQHYSFWMSSNWT